MTSPDAIVAANYRREAAQWRVSRAERMIQLAQDDLIRAQHDLNDAQLALTHARTLRKPCPYEGCGAEVGEECNTGIEGKYVTHSARHGA